MSTSSGSGRNILLNARNVLLNGIPAVGMGEMNVSSSSGNGRNILLNVKLFRAHVYLISLKSK